MEGLCADAVVVVPCVLRVEEPSRKDRVRATQTMITRIVRVGPKAIEESFIIAAVTRSRRKKFRRRRRIEKRQLFPFFSFQLLLRFALI